MLNFKEDFSKIITILSVYSVIVAVLYLWGYWSSFGVNILEFLAITDIVKTAAYSIAFTSIPTIFIIIVCTINMEFLENLRHSNKMINLLLLFIIVAFTIYFLPSLYVILVVLISILSGMLLLLIIMRNNKFIQTHFLKIPTRMEMILLSICLLPPVSFGYGKVNAYNIRRGIKYKYIYAKSLDKKSTPTNIVDKLKFLGYANNYIFLLSMDNKTLLIKNIDKIDDFELHIYNASLIERLKIYTRKPKEQSK